MRKNIFLKATIQYSFFVISWDTLKKTQTEMPKELGSL